MANENVTDLMAAPVQPGIDVQASYNPAVWAQAVATSDGSRQRGNGWEIQNRKTRQRWVSANTYCRIIASGFRTPNTEHNEHNKLCFAKGEYGKSSDKAIAGLGGSLEVAAPVAVTTYAHQAFQQG